MVLKAEFITHAKLWSSGRILFIRESINLFYFETIIAYKNCNSILQKIHFLVTYYNNSNKITKIATTSKQLLL